MKNAQDVFDSHMKAVETLDLDKVIEDYSSDALFITPEQTYHGRDEILGFYSSLLLKFDGFEFRTTKQETKDKLVYFVWNGSNKHLNIKLATDTYSV